MKNKKGFTLIELLAVIVILGLLMAIAIPSVTKYITESRKKTVTSTIGNYIGALVNDVNDLTYTFTGDNTVYAVPIECIALERGGTNPFGAWHQASNAYWAYVLVQYNDRTSSYTYGYTFKDSAGYGLYPTSQAKLNEQGKQIQTGLSLTRPKNGKVTTITELKNWNGFVVNDTTNLVVLEAESEGNTGDGKTTCTLQQKGDNYDQVESEKANAGVGGNQNNENSLANLIKKHNTIITVSPTLTSSSNITSDASGLYQTSDTNSGKYTYYFRGNVTNNNVEFADLKWKVIRINEDGTVRLILNSGLSCKSCYYTFSTSNSSYMDMYYSNSNKAKLTVDNWYVTKIFNKGYDSYVSTGVFCEQAKVKYYSSYTSGNVTMADYDTYVPDFRCKNDSNEKGIVNSKVGLISIDEVIYAGGRNQSNTEYYLYNEEAFWTMSPAGFSSTASYVWRVHYAGSLFFYSVSDNYPLRPVINLKSDVIATGTGTSSDPYVIQTN